jgi:ATP-dependent DNA ligase
MASAAANRSPVHPRHREWRPQQPRPTRRVPPVKDPLLEPWWSGLRVLAHFAAVPDEGGPARLSLRDEDGDEATDAAPEAAAALRDSVMALDAVIDGVLTRQATLGGVGNSMVLEAQVSNLAFILPTRPDATFRRRVGTAGGLAFVALDLLSVDGQDLLDLPLLERKRQLESLFVESDLVRLSPVVRPPLLPWLNSWKSAGFRGLLMKAANSRYRPGELTDEWATVERVNT